MKVDIFCCRKRCNLGTQCINVFSVLRFPSFRFSFFCFLMKFSFDFGFGVRVQRSDRPSNFCQVLFRIVPSIVNRLWNLFSLGQDVDGGPQWNWFLGIYQRTYVAHVYSTNTKTPSASLWANSSTLAFTVPIHSWY